MRPVLDIDPEAIARIRELADEPLAAAEFASWADSPLSADELEEARSMIDWFLRRYPTPEARLRWARRRYRQWQQSTRPRTSDRPGP